VRLRYWCNKQVEKSFRDVAGANLGAVIRGGDHSPIRGSRLRPDMLAEDERGPVGARRLAPAGRAGLVGLAG
jgi:hypothetical protein